MGHITMLSHNFECNGGADGVKRRALHQKLAGLSPDLVLRQEMWGADANGNVILSELEEILGMRGWAGPQCCTAVFINPDLFARVREWPNTGPMHVLPPAALTLRFLPAGEEAVPLAVVSYHLNYASSATRLAEAEWLTTWNDKKWTLPNGNTVAIPAIVGGDNNSFPHDGVRGDVPLPVLEKIGDLPHRVHRSYVGPDGTRVMDTRPDEVLRTAGLDDVARYVALREGITAPLARTVNASPTHGPDSRVDRVYASHQLLPAVAEVDVIEVPLEVSDHHIVRVRLDRDVLTDILRQPVALAA